MKGKRHSTFRSKGPELLIDLADHTSKVVKDLAGLDQDLCDRIGQELTMQMAFNWGGQNIYFPEGHQLKVAELHLRIYNRFNGTNHDELVKEFGISLQHVYRVVKAVQAAEIADRQGGLFPVSDVVGR